MVIDNDNQVICSVRLINFKKEGEKRQMLSKKIKIMFLAILIVLSLFTIFGVQSSAKTIIRFSSAFQPGHILCIAAEHFKDIVESRSNGEIEVQLFLGGVMGSEEEETESVSIGGVEMLSGGPGHLKFYAPEYMFFVSPFVMRDWNQWKAVWNGKLGQEVQDIMAEKGNVKVLGVLYRGKRNFTSNKPIYTPEDVQGLKLRLPPNPTWIACWKEIGASPTAIALPELFSSLQLGVADASEGEVSQIQSFHLNEVQKYLTLTGHDISPGNLVINKKFFDNLSEKNQKILSDAGKETGEWATQQTLEGETQILVDLQKKGMIVVIPDQKAFSEKVKPAIDKLFETEWPVATWEEILSY